MAKPIGRFERAPEPKATPAWAKPLRGPSKASRRDGWSSFARLLRSGVGVPESLRMLAGEGQDALAKAFRDTALKIESGATLADALGEQEGIVNHEELQMIRASERVGDLGPVFEGLADDLQARIGIGRELLRRASYPLMLMISSAVVGPLPTIVTGSAGAYGGSPRTCWSSASLGQGSSWQHAPWSYTRPSTLSCGPSPGGSPGAPAPIRIVCERGSRGCSVGTSSRG
jgi:hypothetical protein